MRYELNDREWAVIKPMLPNKPRGVPRVNDRRVLNGIFFAPRFCFAFNWRLLLAWPLFGQRINLRIC